MVSKGLQSVRGMNDILPSESSYWQTLETAFMDIISRYGYQEIRFPIVESTSLFSRGIGEVTDIVEKEMYTFDDRNGDSLSLRPEGTAGCVRACLQHGLTHNNIQRLWYYGPMFRHERPQKGRYRQFYQIGVEAFGLATPDIDAELILMTARFWQAVGLDDEIKLQINTLGTADTRQAHRNDLIAYLEKNAELLDEDSLRRLHTNPLRILDSKNPAMQSMLTAAPSLIDYLDDEGKRHFASVRAHLDAAGVEYSINPRLVRGLDYYSHTVFEWVTESLGAQGTVCAGGRYDSLVEQLGGKPTPAIGFAMGMERLVALYTEKVSAKELNPVCDAYLIVDGEAAQQVGMQLAEKIRSECPGVRLTLNCGDGKFKNQFKRADKSGANVALILGDNEVAQQQISLKYLREEREQTTMSQTEMLTVLNQTFRSKA